MADKITDTRSLCITNLLVDVLNKDYAGQSYRLASKQLHKTNYETIGQFKSKSLKLLLANMKMERRILLLLLTDVAPYHVTW